ncbi:PLC-like phosphodiesterase [Mytilinidion resinicola]|uniref:PLC-like phosphodiesterase n=1 Tax=Mytilinidion resinicola TaxID=574789 RepID=A0A6A6Z6C8_9PEZI|nr:PLC-like phosphodiesterase [Mytilinidion resinicola]KAF2816590.1 PLC-like phosphodiesterase [Mytilinidion resinicola]
MPSKGVQVYSYISVPGYSIEFTVPAQAVTHTIDNNFSSTHLEVESHNIPGHLNFTGRFEWKVVRDGEVVGSAYNDINTFTGNLEGGTMMSTQHFSPIVTDDVIITYCFYDAGHGHIGLPNRDQCYVTVCSTANRYWMGTFAPPGSPQAQKPFTRFVLAAPHDNGMNSMTTCDAIFSSANMDLISELRQIIPQVEWLSHISDAFILEHLPEIVYGTAITQKKEISVMLALGARYFEFRPAQLLPTFQRLSKLPNKFYFQHACIPGIAFDDFLAQQVAFLDANPTEIVTLHLRYDNIVKQCRRPTTQEIADLLNEACSRAQNAPLTWGDRTLFALPIDALRAAGTRLIVVTEAEKYDSWTAKAYATLVPDPILARFEGMTTEGQESTDLTILQCQATSQSIKEVMVYSVLSANAATSCLTSTKASNDMVLLPWIRQNVVDRLRAERTVVVMNDFIDGATCDTTILLSQRRLEME